MALHYQIQDAVKNKLSSLRLRNNPTLMIAKRLNETEAMMHNTIHLCRSSEVDGDGTIGANAIGFPTVLFATLGTGGAPRDNEELVSEWRDVIYDAFHHKREPIFGIVSDRNLTVTPMICRVDFGSDFLDDYWQKRWDVDHMVIWSYFRRLRT